MSDSLPAPLEFETPERPLDLSVDAVKQLTHSYLNTNRSLVDIGLEIGVSTSVVRAAIKQFGLIEVKKAAIAEAQRTEQAAYVDFLVKNRVPTAEKHLAISNQLVDIVGKLADRVSDPDSKDFQEVCEDLKKSIGTLRTLSEVLEKASGVGARSVNLGNGLQIPLAESLAKAAAANGKRPLISFNLGVPPGNQATPMQAPRATQCIEVSEDASDEE